MNMSTAMKSTPSVVACPLGHCENQPSTNHVCLQDDGREINFDDTRALVTQRVRDISQEQRFRATSHLRIHSCPLCVRSNGDTVFARRPIFNKLFAIDRQLSQIFFVDLFTPRTKQNNKF
jgi:hypothetical protein